MDFLQQLMSDNDLLIKIISNFRASGINDLLDILIIAVVVYELVALARRTHAGQLAKGGLVLVGIFAFSTVFKLRAVSFIMRNVISIGFTAIIILFQPELRRAMEQMGRTDKWAAQLFRGRRYDPTLRGVWQNATVVICDAAEQLSDTRTGALMVLERGTNLDEIIHTGTQLNADLNTEMLGTIFYEGTPLHDGACVIQDGKLVAAGCVLPLSNNLAIGKDMGTRHRAALGMSENSDAIVVVVSEETGIISMAKNGVLIRRLDRQNLFDLLQEEIVPPEQEEEKKHSLWRLLDNAK